MWNLKLNLLNGVRLHRRGQTRKSELQFWGNKIPINTWKLWDWRTKGFPLRLGGKNNMVDFKENVRMVGERRMMRMSYGSSLVESTYIPSYFRNNSQLNVEFKMISYFPKQPKLYINIANSNSYDLLKLLHSFIVHKYLTQKKMSFVTANLLEYLILIQRT
jgi:hypothetical protein